MDRDKLLELNDRIRQLQELAEQARELSADNPSVERNLYMILRHLEMLRAETSDLADILSDHNDRGGTR